MGRKSRKFTCGGTHGCGQEFGHREKLVKHRDRKQCPGPAALYPLHQSQAEKDVSSSVGLPGQTIWGQQEEKAFMAAMAARGQVSSEEPLLASCSQKKEEENYMQDPYEFDGAPSAPLLSFSRTSGPGVLKGSARQKTATMVEVLGTIKEEDSHNCNISSAEFNGFEDNPPDGSNSVHPRLPLTKAYACVWCNATFTQKGTCNRHLYEGSCKKRPLSSTSPSPSKRNRKTDKEVAEGEVQPLVTPLNVGETEEVTMRSRDTRKKNLDTKLMFLYNEIEKSSDAAEHIKQEIGEVEEEMRIFQEKELEIVTGGGTPLNTCSYCLKQFATYYRYTTHECKHKRSDNQEVVHFRVLDKGDKDRFLHSLRHLSRYRQIQACIATKTACPGLYPMMFPHPGDNSSSHLKDIGVMGEEAYAVLKKVLKDTPYHGTLHLPTRVILDLPEEGHIFLPSSLLLPRPSNKRPWRRGLFVEMEHSQDVWCAVSLQNLEEVSESEPIPDYEMKRDDADDEDEDLGEEQVGGGPGGSQGRSGGSDLTEEDRRAMNPHRSPHTSLTPEQIHLLTGISKDQFLDLCEVTRQYGPTSTREDTLCHEAEMLLYLWRFRSTDSYAKIGYQFTVSEQTAIRTKWRVQGYMIYRNPTGSLPSHINHTGITDDQINTIIQNNIDRQSHGIKIALSAVKTQDGRDVGGMIDDTTYPGTTRSGDAHRTQDLYSNKRGHGMAALQGHMTCCAGRVEAVRPGIMASTTPRCGDGIHWAMQTANHERLPPGQACCGFPGLLKGSKTLGVVLITDRGFCRDIPKKYSKMGLLSPSDWCELHGVPFLWPFSGEDEVGLVYDPVNHRICVVPKEDAKGPPSNWSRYVTFLRCAVEQMHAALWRIWPRLQKKQASHMEAVGMATIRKFFTCWQQEGDQEWDQEQAEMCEWYLDYLSCVQIYNHCHAKFYRTHEPWLQEKFIYKILHCMKIEVLVGNEDVKFDHATSLKVPTKAPLELPGYTAVQISDRDTLQQVDKILSSFQLTPCLQRLSLAQLVPGEDEWELVLLSAGEYAKRRAYSVLTGARSVELADDRDAGRTGSQENYNKLCSQLPQAVMVYLAEQNTEPQGWDSERFNGGFPQGGTTTIKMSLAPTHKSWRDFTGHHDVTIVLAKDSNPDNHLRLGPKLQRLVSHNCSCMSGARTSCACAHVEAAVILLFGPRLFRTAKISEPRIADPEKPMNQCPRVGGVPGNDEDLTRSLHPPADPAPKFPSTRKNIVIVPTMEPTVKPLAPQGPADLTGFEPQHHPNMLPPPVPGHSSLLYHLTSQAKLKKKQAAAPEVGADQPTPTSRGVKAPRVKPSPAPRSRPTPSPMGAGQPATSPTPAPKKTSQPKATPSTSTQENPSMQGVFSRNLCSLATSHGVGKIPLCPEDYLRLRHGVYLNNFLVDIGSLSLLSQADPAILLKVHTCGSQLFLLLSGQRLKSGSITDIQEQQEALPLPERRHKRVAVFLNSTNIISREVVLFPCCEDVQQHWFLVAVLLGSDPRVVVLDSLGGRQDSAANLIKELLEVEHVVRGVQGPAFTVSHVTVPQQPDGFNCGLYVLLYTQRILANLEEFCARARQDSLTDWFTASACSGLRTHWSKVIQEMTRQQTTRMPRFPTIQCEPPNQLTGIGTLLNLNLGCFAVSGILMLCFCGVDQNLDLGAHLSPASQHLTDIFTDLARRRRNTTIPPFSPEPLIKAVNGLNKQQFNYLKRQEVAYEFVSVMLEGLSLRPGFMVSHKEVGTCTCGRDVEQPCPDPWIAVVLMAQQASPVSLASIIQTYTSTNQIRAGSFLNCANCNQPVHSRVQNSPGDLLLVQVTRARTASMNVTTSLLEPGLEEVWEGRRLVAVACHEGGGGGDTTGGGHWVCYIQQREVWWRLESLPPRAVQENPFLNQENSSISLLAFM